MTRKSSPVEKILGMAKRFGVLRLRDVVARDIHPEYVRRLHKRGLLVRSGRGTYSAANADVTEKHTLVEACKRVPHAVVCLLSALSFHDLTTQSPKDIWLSIHLKARKPVVDYPPLRIVRSSGAALTQGIERHNIEGAKVRVYNPAKTVADCFKYRNKIGVDVAIEALRDCRRQRKCTNDDLWHYAKICRVAKIMRPYLEATQ